MSWGHFQSERECLLNDADFVSHVVSDRCGAGCVCSIFGWIPKQQYSNRLMRRWNIQALTDRLMVITVQWEDMSFRAKIGGRRWQSKQIASIFLTDRSMQLAITASWSNQNPRNIILIIVYRPFRSARNHKLYFGFVKNAVHIDRFF